MEAKKIYESGKLHGVYRCGKREELVNKIPRIDKEGMPDVTGIVISGIMNFGNDADMIKAIYLKVCSTPAWTNGSPDLRQGLYSRFERECAEALERI